MGVGGNGGKSCGSRQVWDPKDNSHVEGLAKEAEFCLECTRNFCSQMKGVFHLNKPQTNSSCEPFLEISLYNCAVFSLVL